MAKVDIRIYGPLKSACEQSVGQAEIDALIIRLGIMVGPYDPTGRFDYWVRRMAAEGRFLALGDGGGLLQIIDVRDLAEWIITMVEERTAGIYNAVEPIKPLTFREFIETGVRELGALVQPT